MSFSDWLAICLFLIGFGGPKLLGDQWINDHSWIVPVWWTLMTLSVFMVIRKWFNGKSGSPSTALPTVKATSGGPSGILQAAGRDAHAHYYPAPEPIKATPIERHSRILEAVPQLRFEVGTPGLIAGMVSLPGSRGLNQKLIESGLPLDWGKLMRIECTVPFSNAEDQKIAVHLESPAMDPKKTRYGIELHEHEDSPFIKFLVTPRTIGKHRAELQLLGRRAFLGSVSVETKSAPAMRGSDEDTEHWEVIGAVHVEYTVFGRKIAYEQKHEENYGPGMGIK